MSLRTRLIVAFVLLSVVPLTAVTLYSYYSSVRTFQRAVERDASQAAGDISRRMTMVTDDVGRRVDRLFAMAAAKTPRIRSATAPTRFRARMARCWVMRQRWSTRSSSSRFPRFRRCAAGAPGCARRRHIRLTTATARHPAHPPGGRRPPPPMVVDVPGILAQTIRP